MIQLLENENNYVIGLSRSNSYKHDRFEHITIDFRDIEKVKNFRFIKIIDAESITLINNAGMLGNVKRIGSIDNDSIIDVFNVNIVAPFILCNGFIGNYQNLKIKKLILNISSGAGRRAKESWSTYCSSKSALDMLSQVAYSEQSNIEESIAIKVLSIAPGLVDTKMQEEIRNSRKEDFNMLDTFLNYKKEKKLIPTAEIAKKLIRIIENADKFEKSVLDIRELNI